MYIKIDFSMPINVIITFDTKKMKKCLSGELGRCVL